jgi:hypothetical protein
MAKEINMKNYISKRITKNYVRFRIREPSRFNKSSFRIKNIGRPHHHRLVVGKLKGEKKMTVQAVLVNKKNYKEDQAATRKILARLGRRK